MDEADGRTAFRTAVLAATVALSEPANKRLKPSGFSGGTTDQARGLVLAKRLEASGDRGYKLDIVLGNPAYEQAWHTHD
ncbi:hypothetical protein Slala03_55170 [Streptomyces lavendulae subsp. lavendulae]|nr:hypothetical protein Slala03_55170 [Streptomyces lavendulae subsp. lavendulae]